MKQRHVTDDQYTGRVGLMQMVGNSIIRVPIANVQIDSPYLSGQVPEARPADDPNLQWVETQVTRREVEGAPALCQSPEKQWISVNREEIITMQAEDDSLRGPRDMIGEVKVRNQREATFEKKNY